jgi:HEAT repeat protein
MGKPRNAAPPRSSSPTADQLLQRAEIDQAIQDLTVPHRTKDAYWKLRELGPAAREAVEEGLLSDDPRIRSQCALLIDRLAGNDSFELMLLLLDDPEPSVRRHAIHALACDRCKTDDVCALPRAQIIPEASRMLASDPDPLVRAIALETLARWVHEDDDARRAIERAAADDPTPGNRKKATWYLPGGKVFERTRPKGRSKVSAGSAAR